MILFQRDSLQVRLLQEEDAGLLVKWLSDPEVLAFYEGRDRPHDLPMVLDSFYTDEDDETRCIIEYDGQAIGYIQFYLITEEERVEYGYEDFIEGIYGMDQFIGEVRFWNQGIGTLLVKSMIDYLLQERNAGKIVMDPQAGNGRALRVYEKCGFRKKKLLPERELHEGIWRDCWLIEYDSSLNESLD